MEKKFKRKKSSQTYEREITKYFAINWSKIYEKKNL